MQWTILIHGQSGAGKSTFISNFNNALVIDCDDGHKALESERLTPRTWAEVDDIYNLLSQQKMQGQLKYKQIIIDTVTMFHRLAQQAYCDERGIVHEAEVDFKGYPAVRGMMMNMITKFRNLGLGVVFVAHSEEYFVDKLKKKPTQTGKWVPKMDKELFDMLDSIATISMFFQAADMGDHVQRTIHMEGNSLWYAKNRFSQDAKGRQILPPSIPMDFQVFRKHINDYMDVLNAERAEQAEQAKQQASKAAKKEGA